MLQGKLKSIKPFFHDQPHCWSPSGAPSVSSGYTRLHINLESRNKIIVVPLKKRKERKDDVSEINNGFSPPVTAPEPSLPGSLPRARLCSLPAPALLRGRRSRCLIGLESASLCPLTSLMLVGCFLLPPSVPPGRLTKPAGSVRLSSERIPPPVSNRLL